MVDFTSLGEDEDMLGSTNSDSNYVMDDTIEAMEDVESEKLISRQHTMLWNED